MSSVCVSDAFQPPLYAIPDKLRSKKSLGSSESEVESEKSTCQPTEKSGDAQGLQNEQVGYAGCTHVHNFVRTHAYTHVHTHIHTHTHTHTTLTDVHTHTQSHT